MHGRLVALVVLMLRATAFGNEQPPGMTQPTALATPATTSYRTQTLIADALGLSLLVGGGLAEGDGGRDTQASDALFTAGALTMLFATPTIHIAHGHGTRAAGSVLTRVGMSAGGMLVAFYANSNCGDDADLDADFLCELDYIGYGAFGGLLVASIIDAAYRTDETIEARPTTWSPQLSASRDGVRAGVAWTW